MIRRYLRISISSNGIKESGINAYREDLEKSIHVHLNQWSSTSQERMIEIEREREIAELSQCMKVHGMYNECTWFSNDHVVKRRKREKERERQREYSNKPLFSTEFSDGDTAYSENTGYSRTESRRKGNPRTNYMSEFNNIHLALW